MASQGDSSSWGPDQLQRRLQAMDDFQFEHLIADLWEQQGWTTEVEQQSSDAGVDIRATKSQPYPRKALIQAKRYSDKNPVGGPDIQQYSALKQQESDVDEAIIVTTGRFTNSAEDRARDLNVKTIDGEELVDLIDSLGAYSVVESYLGPPTTESRSSQNEPEKGRDPESYIHVNPESRRALEKELGGDLDEFLKDEQYRVMRTKERAKSKTTLNPHDAKIIGLFDDVPEEDFERRFAENKEKLVVHKEDAHMDEEGVVYIEDLTDYISPRAIRGKNEGPIVGEIKRGIQDREWMSDEGEAILKSRESKQWLKQKINSFLGYLEDTEDEKTEENQEGSTAGEALNIDTTRTNWFYGTVVGTVGWFLFVIVTGFSASSALSGLFFFISWPILPISLMMDARKTNFITHHRKRLLYYLIGALVPVIALFSGAAYLYRREYTL